MSVAGLAALGFGLWSAVAGVSGCAGKDAVPGSPARAADLRSNLRIPAGQRFLYAGEADSGAYTASIRNVGSVLVEVRRAETDVPLALLRPGEGVVAAMGKGQGTWFDNPSDQEARLIVLVWGATDVGMRYEDLTK